MKIVGYSFARGPVVLEATVTPPGPDHVPEESWSEKNSRRQREEFDALMKRREAQWAAEDEAEQGLRRLFPEAMPNQFYRRSAAALVACEIPISADSIRSALESGKLRKAEGFGEKSFRRLSEAVGIPVSTRVSLRLHPSTFARWKLMADSVSKPLATWIVEEIERGLYDE